MAIDDFMKADRVVVGARRPEVIEVMADLYQPYLRTDKPLLAMCRESAEMTKYVANAMLSTKIALSTKWRTCANRTGRHHDVRRGIGHDSRIGVRVLSRRWIRRKLLSERRFAPWRRLPGERRRTQGARCGPCG